jgi:hypothetical protein
MAVARDALQTQDPIPIAVRPEKDQGGVALPLAASLLLFPPPATHENASRRLDPLHLRLGHLHRMQVVIGGDLLDGLHPLDRLKADPGLELGSVVSSFLLQDLCGVLPPQRSSLKATISLAPFHPAISRTGGAAAKPEGFIACRQPPKAGVRYDSIKRSRSEGDDVGLPEVAGNEVARKEAGGTLIGSVASE